MKKSLLALAVLGAFAGAASAQSALIIYGKIDEALMVESLENAATHAGAGKDFGLGSAAAGSRIGFKGVEDLGGGLKANFLLETGLCVDSTANNNNSGGFCSGGGLFGRQAWAGLNGSFGTLTLGRQYAQTYLNIAAVDPTTLIGGGPGTAAGSINLFNLGGSFGGTNPTTGAEIGHVTRINNAVTYSIPPQEGVSASVQAGFGEKVGDVKADRLMGGSVSYTGGPLYVGLGYSTSNNVSDQATKNTNLGATYAFDPVKVHGLFQKTTAPSGNWQNANDFLLGVSGKIGDGTALASYQRHNDKTASNKDGSQIGVAYTYPLSKRTSWYSAIAKLSNTNGATFSLQGATGSVAPAYSTSVPNVVTKALNVGLIHNF